MDPLLCSYTRALALAQSQRALARTVQLYTSMGGGTLNFTVLAAVQLHALATISAGVVSVLALYFTLRLSLVISVGG